MAWYFGSRALMAATVRLQLLEVAGVGRAEQTGDAPLDAAGNPAEETPQHVPNLCQNLFHGTCQGGRASRPKTEQHGGGNGGETSECTYYSTHGQRRIVHRPPVPSPSEEIHHMTASRNANPWQRVGPFGDTACSRPPRPPIAMGGSIWQNRATLREYSS